MLELDEATVTAANDAWVGAAPEGAEVLETGEFRLVLLPERFPDRLQAQWVRSTRPADAVVDDLVARAAAFGQPNAFVMAKAGAPEGFDEALLARGGELLDTADILARPLPGDVDVSDVPGLEVRWRATAEVTRDANRVGIAIFGGTPADDETIAAAAQTSRESFESGAGGAVVAYVNGTPAGIAGLQIVDGIARLWGGGVLEEFRGLGVYRAMVATRLAYAAEKGARMALSQGKVTTSSPILRRLGFKSYGQERSYRLPLG